MPHPLPLTALPSMAAPEGVIHPGCHLGIAMVVFFDGVVTKTVVVALSSDPSPSPPEKTDASQPFPFTG